MVDEFHAGRINSSMKKVLPSIWEVRPSVRLEGEVGLFASCNLTAGTLLIRGDEFDETWVTWNKLNIGTDQPRIKGLIEKWCYFDDDGVWLPRDFKTLPVYYHINHSCEPNIGHTQADDWVALRDISSNEELFMDFRLTCLAPWYRMECFCGTPTCAGTIRGDAWMERSFAMEKLNSFPPYARAKVVAYHGLDT
jgi:hypothetical protein